MNNSQKVALILSFTSIDVKTYHYPRVRQFLLQKMDVLEAMEVIGYEDTISLLDSVYDIETDSDCYNVILKIVGLLLK